MGFMLKGSLMGKIVSILDATACDPFDDPIDRIIVKLVKLFAYPETGATFIAPQIRQMSKSLQEPFRTYWNTLKYDPEVAAENYSLADLTQHFHPIAAFLALDDLTKDPTGARARVRRKIAGRHAFPAWAQRFQCVGSYVDET